MTRENVPFRFVNVVWGRAYVDQFVSLCLPSQLTPGNLPRVAREATPAYHLYVSRGEVQQLRAAPAFQALERLMPVKLLLVEDVCDDVAPGSASYHASTLCHRHFIQSCGEPDVALSFLMPDAVWSDGALGALVDHARAGKRFVAIQPLRVSAETFVPTLSAAYLAGPGQLRPVPPRELARLGLPHLHPIERALMWDEAQISEQPSRLLWRAQGEGLLVRSFHMHPLMARPRLPGTLPLHTLDHDYVGKCCERPDDLHVVTDSDEACLFTLTPRDRVAAGVRPGRKNTGDLQRWAAFQTNQQNRTLALQPLRYHGGDCTPGAWQAAEFESNEVIKGVADHFAPEPRIEPGQSAPPLTCWIPNLNHGHYLGSLLERVLAQSVQPLEVLVIDDGSTDKSVEIIEQFTRRAAHVRLIRNTERRGVEGICHDVLKVARGTYLYCAAADDYPLPGFFEKCLALLGKHPQAGLSCTDPVFLRNEGDYPEWNRLRWSPTARYLTPAELAETINGGYIAGHTVIVKRDLFASMGGYPEELAWHSDWYCWHSLAFRHGICYVPEGLAAARVRGDSYSTLGRSDWSKQGPIMNLLLQKLRAPENADLLPHFARGAVLSHFADELPRFVMSRPDLWDATTMMLLQQPLLHWSVQMQRPRQERALEDRTVAREHDFHTTIRETKALLRDRKVDEAVTLCDAHTRRYPESVAMYLVHARLESSRGNRLGVIQVLSRGLSHNPRSEKLKAALLSQA